MEKNKLTADMKDILDDDQLRDYFESRDPKRKKNDPFLDADVEESVRGKSSGLTVKQPKEEKEYGISYSQHQKHTKNIARHFFFMGVIMSLLLAILIQIIF